MEESKGLDLLNKKNIHFLIGVGIMFVVGMIPPVDPITDVGMKILGIFIGTLYLWTTTDVLWSSVLCIAAIGICGYDTMGAVLTASFGNSTVVQTLFMLIYVGALVEEGISNHIGRWFLSRKISQGRPWVFVFTICIGCFLYSVFMGPFLPIFLFWPVCYGIFKEVGYTNKDLFPKIMLIMIVLSCAAGFPVAPYKGNALALLGNYRNILGDATFVNDGTFFAITFALGLLFLIISLLISKYVFRPNTDPIKNFDITKLTRDPLPPLDTRQMFLGISFVVFALAMLIPSWFPNAPVMGFLYKNSIGLAALFVGILAAIHIAGEPVLKAVPALKKQVDWGTIFLVAAAIELGSVLTNQKTGISAALSQFLSPVFGGMSYFVFVIVLMLVAMVLTNVCNSLVIGMILEPIILIYAQTTGVNAAPVLTLLIFFVLSCALFTPAASPFAALMFSNKDWLRPADICKLTGVFILAEFALVICLGFPLTTLLL